MQKRFTYLALIFVMIPFVLNAQTVQVKAIEIYGQDLTGTDDLGLLTSVLSNTRNPEYFRTDELSFYDEKSTQSVNGFSIDFHLTRNEHTNHEFIIGIQSGSIESYITTTATVVFDSAATNTFIINKSEYFTLKSGYQRVFRADKKLKLTAGAVLNVGVPVSSITTQSFITIFGEESYRFFGKQSAAFGLSVPLSARLKLVKNTSISLTSRPTFFFHSVDGNLSSTLFRGTHLSLHFKLRNP